MHYHSKVNKAELGKDIVCIGVSNPTVPSKTPSPSCLPCRLLNRQTVQLLPFACNTPLYLVSPELPSPLKGGFFSEPPKY